MSITGNPNGALLPDGKQIVREAHRNTESPQSQYRTPTHSHSTCTTATTLMTQVGKNTPNLRRKVNQKHVTEAK
jgi:hypothetical protein